MHPPRNRNLRKERRRDILLVALLLITIAVPILKGIFHSKTEEVFPLLAATQPTATSAPDADTTSPSTEPKLCYNQSRNKWKGPQDS